MAKKPTAKKGPDPKVQNEEQPIVRASMQGIVRSSATTLLQVARQVFPEKACGVIVLCNTGAELDYSSNFETSVMIAQLASAITRIAAAEGVALSGASLAFAWVDGSGAVAMDTIGTTMEEALDKACQKFLGKSFDRNVSYAEIVAELHTQAMGLILPVSVKVSVT